MSEPYIGQIMLASFSYAPKNYAQCNGAVMPINQNQALFALLGTTYGGDGVTLFKLPDLRGRTPLGMSASPGQGSYALGQAGGAEGVSLLDSQVPPHVHAANYSSQAASLRIPGTSSLFGDTGATALYANATGPQVPLNPATLGAGGQGTPHPNLQPYSVLNFCIALSGVFPSRN